MKSSSVKIVVLDYGSGNVKSVANSLSYLELDYKMQAI